MMPRVRLVLCLLVGLAGCSRPPEVSSAPTEARVPSTALRSFALGSCLDQHGDLGILETIRASTPELLLLMGDNVYADAESEPALTQAYGALAARSEYLELVGSTPLLAVWDDHDYGTNDAGRENPIKEESKRIMLDFFGEAPDSERRVRAGNYDVVTLGPAGFDVQFILLDTRWFRSRPSDPDATMLGEAQWSWLEAVLRRPAALRFLVTSIQFIPDEHPYERWGSFPDERARLIALLKETGAAPLVLLSGDRHHAELSCATAPGLDAPLYEFTASSFNRPRPEAEANRTRVAGTRAVTQGNFGRVEIDWEQRRLRLSSVLASGEPAWTHTIAFPEPGGSPPPHCPPLTGSPPVPHPSRDPP